MHNYLDKLLICLSKEPERYLIKTLNAFYSFILLPIPVIILSSTLHNSGKIIYMIIWATILLLSILRIENRGHHKIKDIFEGSFCCIIITVIFYATGMHVYLLSSMYIGLGIFSFILSLRNAISLSFFEIIIYLFVKAYFVRIGLELFDASIAGFIFTGSIMGLIGNILRSSFEKSKQLENSRLDTIKAFVEAIEAKDTYTSGHSIMVSQYSKMIAQKLGLSCNMIKNIEEAALLHDIGKIGVSDVILNKKGALSHKEYAEIKLHPVIGSKILSNLKNVSNILPFIQSHHERIDGAGYPDGLSGSHIPIGARIISVADAYEAMTSDRPYRKALTKEEASKRLIEGKGTQFSPGIVDVFLSMLYGEEIEHAASSQLDVIPTNRKRKNILGFLNINTLNKKVNYGLIVIGLIPVLLGTAYITTVTLSEVENISSKTRIQQTNAFFMRLNERFRIQENTLTDYSNWDEMYEQVKKKTLSGLEKM